MDFFFYSEEIELPAIDQERICRWINRIVFNHGCKTGEITYIFCSSKFLKNLNQKYLNHDFCTDIITFDYVDGVIISGDIFISPETVKSNAEYYGVEFENELHRVIIHGILHLLGIQDKTDQDKKLMTMKEDESLAILSGIS